MDERPQRLTAGFQIVRCLFYSVLFLVWIPPLIVLDLSMVDQTSSNISVKDFNITELPNINASNSNNSAIYFKLIIENTDETMLLYYQKLNLTFSYNASGGIVPVAYYTIPAFKQKFEKKTERKDYVLMNSGISWQGISRNASSSSSGVVFRVDLSSAVKFQVFLWSGKSKTRKIMAWANVEVDRNTGKKIKKKPIKLKHVIVHHNSRGKTAAFVIMASSPVWLCLLLVCCCCICAAGK